MMMKKIISLAFALTCFFSLVSCEGEDEGGNYVTPNYVASNWEVTQIGALNNQNVVNYQDVNSVCSPDTFLFNEDMNFTRTINGATNDGNCVATATNGTYQITGGNIVLNYTGSDGAAKKESLKIIALTNTELSIVYTADPVTGKLAFLKMKRIVAVVD